MRAPRWIFLLGVLAVSTVSGASEPPARPNVIVIITDDQGWGDVGLHDNPRIRTPNLDRFARDGVRLTRFYVNPVCAPTRASLMTGRHYYRTGVIHTSRGGAKMHADEVTLAELLAKAGYRTGIFGKWHLGDNYPMRPQDQGFQECLTHLSGGLAQPPYEKEGYFDPLLFHNGQAERAKGYCTDVFFQAAEQFIATRSEQPFFAYIATNAPHTPLEVADKQVAPYLAAGLDDTTARVYAMVENIDANFGRLLAKLDELKIRDNTLIVFLTDNGPQQERYTGPYRGRKTMTYDGGVRVPCFVQWPGQFAGGRKMDRLAAHIDLLPTIAEICGADRSGTPPIDGQSLLPLLLDERAAWPDRTLCLQSHRGLTPRPYQNCAAITERFKWLAAPESFNREYLPPGQSPQFELYDLTQDMGERHNLLTANPAEAERLKQAYDAWFADVRATRDFKPGVIHLGTPHENPARLCLNQDATFVGQHASGWSARIPEGGRFRVTLVGDLPAEAMTLRATWLGQTTELPLATGQRSVELDLPAGEGQFDITSTAAIPGRKILGTFCDVDVERLSAR